MHTLNRFLVTLCLAMTLVPPATFALISLDEKHQAEQSLDHAIGDAVVRYQQRSGLQAVKGKGEKLKRESEVKLQALEERKRDLRAQLVKQHRILHAIEDRYGLELDEKEKVASLITAEKERLSAQLRRQYVRVARAGADNPGAVIVDAVFNGTAREYGEHVVSKAQRTLVQDLTTAEKILWRIDTLTREREATLADYHQVEKTYENASSLIERSTAQMEEIKTIMADVHEQVLKLQGELARIDARLRSKAERELIEKGLLDPKTAGSTSTLSAGPQFSWPVYGRVSAGFMNHEYKLHFGVPHHGMDIVTGQGTPVAAAADGVVFLVRDGGETGYSYVLIGHRGGYATLYGHMSAFDVVAGQDVRAGQVIGLSGGQPGTPGAGPMTTGPHLHFEVIRAGVNVDPATVLP